MEDLMKAFIIKTYERLEIHGTTTQERGTAIQNLERQVRKIANLLSASALGALQGKLIQRQVETVKEYKNNENQEGEVRVDPKDALKRKMKTRALKKKKKNENLVNEETGESKYMYSLPFPQKQRREKMNKQFGHFLEVLKQVHVNLPFIEVLSQMPSYAKILKEILSNKQKLEKEIGVIRSRPVSLQLEDQTIIIPEGIIEDVLVQVNKFTFPMDFIVVNIEDNKEVPLILGRSFLSTGSSTVDIQER
ncbi:uncharacterized protein [Nicotiana sylvestris]|uniref:uncharacterized protein n=1 Tax=Nicotiana sylvestris TaxID=4096 RepID=UPI00388C3FD9